MKYIVLAAGKGNSSFDLKLQLPKCLLKIDNKTVIDNILEIAKKNNISDVNIVAGFEILKIMENYPSLKYFYNENWENTKSLYSLSKVVNIFDSDLIISYSDIIHRKQTILKLIKNRETVNVVYDSKWKSRYENRDSTKVEKIYNKKAELKGEFTGLLYIPKSQIDGLIFNMNKLLSIDISATILDLIELLIYSSEVNLIDVNGNWAELDSVQDIEHFKFGTKAETLNTLKLKVKKSKILEQYTFTVDDYTKNKDEVINDIKNKLQSKLLVVRSSALNEDTHNSSMAGNYESILKVPINKDSILSQAIEKVIESYTKGKQGQDSKNQILVQPYLENVLMSGVLFSKNLQTSSPYYTVNYDESDDTESVTSGNGSELNTFVCYKKFKSEILDKRLKKLINAVIELESITKFDAIDVEFAFTKNELFILQVRPIAASKDSIKVSDIEIDIEIEDIKTLLTNSKNNPNLCGSQIGYGVMPDWNPAEIIGINPKQLAFDLYKYIITDNIWAKSRESLGYRDVYNSAGLISFGGKPYVDIRMSFNTFIPDDLDDDLASKLVDYFILKLKKNPENHDKVEFHTVITAFDFSFDEKMDNLLQNGFDETEIEKIILSYRNLTENIIIGKETSCAKELEKLNILTRRREKIISSNISAIDKIYNLLEDCKYYGTLPFSNLARFGFVGSILIKSLLKRGLINEDQYDNFFKSIHTIAKSFMDDFDNLISGKVTKDEFLESYGHLRPGTYDITSLSYKEGFTKYIDVSRISNVAEKLKTFSLSDETKDIITKEIEKYSLKFTVDELLEFIIKATEAREKAKFEFTKNLSLVLDLISQIGENVGIKKEEMAYVNLNMILKYKNTSERIDIENNFKHNISNNKQKYLLTSAIQLPELIFEEKDIEMFFYSALKPNFVTHHNIVNDMIFLDNDININIDNKIVFIENADPGFDWIFSHNIKGLVTKYGGAASHMAIRCAEFDLPAAIGCGDKIFNDLIRFTKVSLDCVNHQIKGLS